MARAHAEEKRAETAGVTPMEVMEHAYDALGHLGGSGTTIVLGDWAHVPGFLFPHVPSMQAAFQLPYGPFGGAPMGMTAPRRAGGGILSEREARQRLPAMSGSARASTPSTHGDDLASDDPEKVEVTSSPWAECSGPGGGRELPRCAWLSASFSRRPFSV